MGGRGEEGFMRRGVLALVTLIVAASVLAAPAGSITQGQLDGNTHPEVGALIAEYVQPGEKDVLCSGTLIAPTVFLTAGHCTEFLSSIGISDVWVTFDPEFTSSSTLHHGSFVTDPNYGYSGQGGLSNPHDLAVILLDEPVSGITPARLPTANLLGTTNLKGRTFTAVGYGTVREIKTTGPNAFFFDAKRRYATQSFQNVLKAWLDLDMNPSTGSGGTCYGDSGGPHFLGGLSSNLEVSITITGDTACRSTDKTYRLDTLSARGFIGQYVDLP
jgi:secreted trypsin-like serine protease